MIFLNCSKREVNPISPTAAEGVNFIGELYDKGIGYSGLKGARSRNFRQFQH